MVTKSPYSSHEKDIDLGIDQIELEDTSSYIDRDTGVVYNIEHVSKNASKDRKQAHMYVAALLSVVVIFVSIALLWGTSLAHIGFFNVENTHGRTFEQVKMSIQDSYVEVSEVMERVQPEFDNEFIGDEDLDLNVLVEQLQKATTDEVEEQKPTEADPSFGTDESMIEKAFEIKQ